MSDRKPSLNSVKRYCYYFKSIHGLWIPAVFFINIVIPLINYVLYSVGGETKYIEIEKTMYFAFPIFSVWTMIFIAALFFSDETKDILFFYPNKNKLKDSVVFFLIFYFDTLIVVLFHKYCIYNIFEFAIKLGCVSVFFFGLAIGLLKLSRSSETTIMVLLIYVLMNTIIGEKSFPLFYESFSDLNLKLFIMNYFSLLLIGLIIPITVFFDLSYKRLKCC